MNTSWLRWTGLFLMLGMVITLATGGCLDFGPKEDNGSSTPQTQPGPGISYSYFISGRATASGAALQGVTMNLTGSKTDSTSTDQNGNYTFLVNNGNYIVTPSKTDYSFSPGSMALSINGSSWSGVNFSGTSTGGGGGGGGATTYSISGQVTGAGDATISLSGPAFASTITDNLGNYTFAGLTNGTYTVTPSKSGYTFNPSSRSAMVSGTNVTGINFTGASYSGTTYSISGNAGSADVMLTLNGPAYRTLLSDVSGNYTFNNLMNGSYTITPNKDGYYFTPQNRYVTVNGNVTNQNFTPQQDTANTYTIYGNIRDQGGMGMGNVPIDLTGSANRSTSTDFYGNYMFPDLSNGTYTVTPQTSQTVTVPANRNVTINNADSYNNDFDVVTAFSISGTVNYTGTETGRIFLQVQWNGGGETSWGTSISAPGAFTIRGVQAGAYKISARMDNIGNKNDGEFNEANPAGMSTAVNVTNADVTGVNVTLGNPGVVTTVATAEIMAVPSDGAVLLFWNTDNPNPMGGEETAASYKIYGGTNPAITPTANYDWVVTVDARDDGNYWKTGLTNGTVYYFVLTASSKDTPESAPSPVISATASALSGWTVEGNVTLPNTLSYAGKNLGVGLYTGDESGQPEIYMSNPYPSPATTQAYIITGVPNGTYYLFAFVDMNGNGVIDSGDPTNMDRGGIVVVNNGNVTMDIAVSGANTVAIVRTGHNKDISSNWENYSVDVRIQDGMKSPVKVTLIAGPNVFSPVDMAKNWGEFQAYIDMKGARPNVGNTYTVEVTYGDGTTENITAAIQAVLDAFATNLTVNPTPSAITPTFTWSAPTTAPQGYTYRFRIEEVTQYGSMWLWEYPRDGQMPSTQTSVVFNVDGKANQTNLTSGKTYRWTLGVGDDKGNSATIQSEYTP